MIPPFQQKRETLEETAQHPRQTIHRQIPKYLQLLGIRQQNPLHLHLVTLTRH